jgi:hypothetical protein
LFVYLVILEIEKIEAMAVSPIGTPHSPEQTNDSKLPQIYDFPPLVTLKDISQLPETFRDG